MTFQQRRCFSTSTPSRLTKEGQRLVLGIESSCDDSCVALVSAPESYTRSTVGSTSKAKLLQEGAGKANDLSSGARVLVSKCLRQDHSLTQGIHPIKAQHAHMAAMPLALLQCLSEGNISRDGREIDAIAVTQGPGMAGCLSVGLATAKTLAALWRKPLIPIHHMEAHALTPFLSEDPQDELVAPELALVFPFLTLLLSGGHTMLALVRGVGEYKILATTGDESLGDSFDKVAKLLEIPTDWMKRSPGASLEAFAAAVPKDISREKQQGMINFASNLRGEAKFSFSGIRSAVMRSWEDLIKVADQRLERHPSETTTATEVPLLDRQVLAKRFQSLAFDLIEDKLRLLSLSTRQKGVNTTSTSMPPEWEPFRGEIAKCRHLVISGGVAANEELRRRLRRAWNREGTVEQAEKVVMFPPLEYCVDVSRSAGCPAS